MTKDYYIGWWNLENLFDVEDYAHRSDKLKSALERELAGWDQVVLDRKLTQLSKVINAMNNGKGPDLLGVCEIENQRVMDQLAAKITTATRSYKTAHHDMSDKRGIDVGFIYDETLFEKKEEFSYHVRKRTATRDIYQINFVTKPADNPIVIIGNHWPARSAGVYKSEPYRIIAAETLAYWHDRIEEEFKDQGLGNPPIVVVGDFNDEPFNRSLVEYALSTRQESKVIAATTAPRLLNLLWGVMGSKLGTFNYKGTFNLLDQLLVSKGLLDPNWTFTIDKTTIEIINTDPETGNPLDKPKPFGRPSKGNVDNNGYSDHFPIAMILKEKD